LKIPLPRIMPTGIGCKYVNTMGLIVMQLSIFIGVYNGTSLVFIKEKRELGIDLMGVFPD
ncbi:MAG: hypothetical protein AAFV80_12220, partial [Bacteroidota bacterium]